MQWVWPGAPGGGANTGNVINSPFRAGPGASWLDRLMETERPEYLDREEVPPERRRAVLRGLDRYNRITGAYSRWVRWTLDELDGVEEPRVLELGAGHGELSRRLLRAHPRLRITVSDVDTDSVAVLQAGDLGRHPRADVALVDATAIDAPDHAYDLAVFVQSLHHLAPPLVAAVFREATRAARTLLVIDLQRLHPLLFALNLALFPVEAAVLGYPAMHDGVISLRKAYNATALHALATECGAPVTITTQYHPPLF